MKRNEQNGPINNKENSGRSDMGLSLVELFRNKQFSYLLLGVIMIAIVLIYWGKEPDVLPATTQVKPVEQVNSSKISTMEKEIEDKLRESLQMMKGVGRVSISVSLSSGLKSEYVHNDNVTKRTQKQSDKSGGTSEITEETKSTQLALSSGSSQPVIIMEQKPEINGVLIIAEGASNAAIREQIHTAVRTLLNIPANKVSVAAMGGI